MISKIEPAVNDDTKFRKCGDSRNGEIVESIKA